MPLLLPSKVLGKSKGIARGSKGIARGSKGIARGNWKNASMLIFHSWHLQASRMRRIDPLYRFASSSDSKYIKMSIIVPKY